MNKVQREAADTRILEEHCARLNREALDVLEYQRLGRNRWLIRMNRMPVIKGNYSLKVFEV